MYLKKIELRELSLDDGKDILDMIREIGPGENGFINDGYDMDQVEFRNYLSRNIDISRGIGLQQDWVPQTKYWLYVDGHPVGIGKLRHHLNENLRKYGGHIGYCIRPSERGKGYGNVLLGEALKKAWEKGVPKVLVTCNSTNAPSRKVIEHNGGCLASDENGECLFWINLASGGIRELHIDDYEEFYEMWRTISGMGLSEADSRDNILKFLNRNKGLSFCFEEGGRITGTVLCGHDGRRGYIYHAAVAEGSRGKGIGSKLVEKCLQKLRAEGIQKCHIFVFGDNEPGNAFWKTSGWTKREDIFVYSKNT